MSSIVLRSCAFVRLVTANNATCRCAKDGMVTSEMARSAAHHSTFQAALGVRGRNCCHGKESSGATKNRFHLSLQVNHLGKSALSSIVPASLRIRQGRGIRHHPPGEHVSKREPQIILKTDERSTVLELRRDGQIRGQIKAVGVKIGFP